MPYRTLGFPEYGLANASNFTRGFTPASNPERCNNIWATKWAFIYVKMAKAKNSVITYLRVPRVGETGVGCHTGWLSHCQYLIRWMAVPCEDLHVTCA